MVLSLINLETTATSLSWALFALANHPEIQNKLRATLPIGKPTWDEIQNNKYLQGVCTEVLRLYTPVPSVIRRTTKSFTFKGIYFPKDIRFNVPIQELHYVGIKDPLVFNPEREPAETYLPFWNGHRGCIGKQLALVEFATLLTVLVKSYKFSISDAFKDVKRVSRITQRPDSLRLTIEKVLN